MISMSSTPRNARGARHDAATGAATSIVNESSTAPAGNRPEATLRVRLARGLAWNLVGATFNQGSTFAANLVLANLLAVQVFGEYAMVQSTVAVLSLLGQLATGYTATRYVSEYRGADTVRAGRLLGMLSIVSGCMGVLVSAGLALSASWLSSVVLDQPGLAGPMRIAAMALFFSVMNGFLMGALAGLEAYGALGRTCVIGGSAYFGVAVVGGWIAALEGAISGVALAGALQTALLWRAVLAEAAKQGIVFRVAFGLRDADTLLSFTLPAALNGFVSVPVIWFGNALLVRQDSGYHWMALFTAANSFRIIALFLPAVVNNVNMSLLNHQVGLQDGRRYLSVFWVNFGLTVAITCGVSGAAILFAPWLLGWFGSEFRAAYPVLVLLLLAAIPESLSLALVQVVQSHARMWFTFLCVSAPSYGALAVVAWLLVPEHHAVGLAWAYVVAAIVAVTANTLIVRRLGLRLAHPASPAVERHETGSSNPG